MALAKPVKPVRCPELVRLQDRIEKLDSLTHNLLVRISGEVERINSNVSDIENSQLDLNLGSRTQGKPIYESY